MSVLTAQYLTAKAKVVSTDGTEWTNNFEFVNNGTPSATDFGTLAQVIAEYMAQFHPPTRTIQSVLISDWMLDSSTTDGFVNVNTNQVGLFAESDPDAPYNVVLWVTRETLLGRSGKIFFRGCLYETAIKSGGDEGWVANTDDPAWTAIVTAHDAAVVTYLSPYLDGSDPNFQMAMLSNPLSPIVKEVTGLSIRGVTENKVRRKPPTPTTAL